MNTVNDTTTVSASRQSIRFVDIEDIPLPASAQASIYANVSAYIDWLTQRYPDLSYLVQIDWINFHARCKDIPPYETLGMMMQTAPYYERFLAEQSWAAYMAVQGVKS